MVEVLKKYENYQVNHSFSNRYFIDEVNPLRRLIPEVDDVKEFNEAYTKEETVRVFKADYNENGIKPCNLIVLKAT